MTHMDNINDYDSSFSPNEAAEGAGIPDCEVCCDTGMMQICDGEDFCDCEVGVDALDEWMQNDEGYQMSDVEADADALASCGWGTDEDYGCYGGDEW